MQNNKWETLLKLGDKTLYPKVRTTLANKEHKKYSYLLKAFKNNKNQVVVDTPKVVNSGCEANFPVNQVWSTDITYIKLEKGFVYLAAIIDWNTKKILSWKLSCSETEPLSAKNGHTWTPITVLLGHPKRKHLDSENGFTWTLLA